MMVVLDHCNWVAQSLHVSRRLPTSFNENIYNEELESNLYTLLHAEQVTNQKYTRSLPSGRKKFILQIIERTWYTDWLLIQPYWRL